MEKNLQAYSSEETVEKYKHYNALQKGEKTIFEKYKNTIATARVLDIGIGGGRTTAFLSRMAKEYVGVDFSKPFVDHCRAKYANMPNVVIDYGDARDLHNLASRSFDFILFSYNGIDYVDWEGRKQILSECSRLLCDDGILCFSFHNKGNLDKLYSFQYPRNPIKYLWEWHRMKKVKAINGRKDQYKSKNWFIIKDGGEDFTLDTFYTDPAYQEQCLRELGFKNFYFHDAVTGKELTEAELPKSETPWIYVTAFK